MMKSKSPSISDEEKLDGLLIWIKHDTQRKDLLMEMVENINVCEVPVTCRRYVVENEPLVKDDIILFRMFCMSILNTMNIGSRETGVVGRKYIQAIVCFDENSGQLQCFSPMNKAWKQMQVMHGDMTRLSFTAVTLGDHIFALMSDKRLYRLKYTNEISTWERMSDISDDHGTRPLAVVLLGNIYLIGGHHDISTISAEMYYPAIDKWVNIRHRPHSSKKFTLLASRGFAYTFGGFLDNEYLNIVERFDPARSTWTKLVPMLEKKRSALAAEFDDNIYVIGGYYNGRYLSCVERYNTVSNQWTLVRNLSVARSLGRAFVLNNTLYAVGGDVTSPNSIEKYIEEKNEWTMVQIPGRITVLESVEIRTSPVNFPV